MFCIFEKLHARWNFVCKLGLGMGIWTMNILYIDSFDGQTHFGMQRGAKMSLALNEQIWVVLRSNHHTKIQLRNWKFNENKTFSISKTTNSRPTLRLDWNTTLMIDIYTLLWLLFIQLLYHWSVHKERKEGIPLEDDSIPGQGHVEVDFLSKNWDMKHCNLSKLHNFQIVPTSLVTIG